MIQALSGLSERTSGTAPAAVGAQGWASPALVYTGFVSEPELGSSTGVPIVHHAGMTSAATEDASTKPIQAIFDPQMRISTIGAYKVVIHDAQDDIESATISWTSVGKPSRSALMRSGVTIFSTSSKMWGDPWPQVHITYEGAVAILAQSSDSGFRGPAVARWNRTVEAIRTAPELRENILRSVMTSMALEGFQVDREESERLLDEVLNGPPLEYPGKG